MQELLDIRNPHPLVRLDEPPKPKPQSWGLLQELLGGRLDVLTADALHHPERYDESTRALLSEISSNPLRAHQLNLDEQTLLNRAVIDYAAFKPRQPTPPVPKRAPPPIPKVLLEEESGRAPQIEEDGPGGVMSPYWWLS